MGGKKLPGTLLSSGQMIQGVFGVCLRDKMCGWTHVRFHLIHKLSSMLMFLVLGGFLVFSLKYSGMLWGMSKNGFKAHGIFPRKTFPYLVPFLLLSLRSLSRIISQPILHHSQYFWDILPSVSRTFWRLHKKSEPMESFTDWIFARIMCHFRWNFHR